VRGTVIMLSGKLNGLERIGDSTVRAEAGVASAKLARFSVQQGCAARSFWPVCRARWAERWP